MKKITAIVIAAVLVIGAACTAAFFLLRKNAPAEAESVLSNTLRDMFGEFAVIFPKTAEEEGADAQLSVHAEVILPESLIGLSDKAEISADIWEQNDSGTVSADVKIGKQSVGVKGGVADGRVDIGLTAGEHRYALGFDVDGIGAVLDKSWMNPDVNPDSPFDAENYKKVRLAFEKAEDAYNELRKASEAGSEDSEQAETFANRVKKLKEDILKLPDVRTERENRKKGTSSVIIDISTADIVDAVKYISEFLEEEEVKDFLSGRGIEILTGEDETGKSGTDETPDPDEILKEIEDTGIRFEIIADIAGKRIESMYITSEYTEKEAGEGASEEEKTVNVRLTLSVTLNYEEKKLSAELTEFRDGQKADTGTLVYSSEQNDSGYVWKLDVSIREKDAEEDIKHSVRVEYAKADGAFTVKADEEEIAAGHFTSKDGKVVFSLEKLTIHYDEEFFEYGVGMKTEKRTVLADNFISLTVSRDDSAKTDVPRGDDLVGLTEEKRNELFGENGVSAGISAFIQSVAESAQSARFTTADGVRVFTRSKAQARTEEILNSYLRYVNNTLGPQAFTLESAYVCIYDEFDSKLFYLIDASSGTAYISVYTYVDPETAKYYHQGSLNNPDQLVLHTFNVLYPEVPCGEQAYLLKTCVTCGLTVKQYTGGVSAHEYTESSVSMDSALHPGTKVNVKVTECKKCGQLILDSDEGYQIVYDKTDGGYEAKSIENNLWEYYYYTPPLPIFKNYTSLYALALALPPAYSGEKIVGIGENFCGSMGLLDSVYIGEGTEYIGADAFAGMGNLRVVVLPSSLKKINDGAFRDCGLLKRVIFCGTEEQWQAIDKGNNEKLFTQVLRITGGKTVGPEDLYDDFPKPEDFISIHKSALTVEKNSVTKLSSLVSKTSGTTVITAKLTNSPEAYITSAVADDKNGVFVIVSDQGGRADAYDRTGKNLCTLTTDLFMNTAAGEGYFTAAIYAEGKRFVDIYDTKTMKCVLSVPIDYNEFGEISMDKKMFIMNGKLYALTGKALIEIDLSDGSIVKNSAYNQSFDMACDKQRGLLVFAIYDYSGGGTWSFYDPAAVKVIAAFRFPYCRYDMVSDGLGVRGVYFDEYPIISNGKEVTIESIMEITVTPDGYWFSSADNIQAAKGYTADRVIYRDADTVVYTAFNSKNTACTVFVYKGKTKVVPVVLQDVENVGNGVFLLWKKMGTREYPIGKYAVLVNVNK